jgi:nitronate monooxygenase
VIRQPRLADHLDVLTDHHPEIVITSVGSPAPAVAPLHAVGTLVLADVASISHARKAIDAGADGLILLSAGAGGQTGWLNPLAFVRAVREFYDGLVVVAGGISDGHALRAVTTLGADLGYMGTAFLAAQESMAPPRYQDMVVASTADDVILTRAFTGLPASMLRPSIQAAGLDPDNLAEDAAAPDAAERYGPQATGPRRWENIWSAGHSVGGVHSIRPAAAIIEQVVREYQATLSRETP